MIATHQQTGLIPLRRSHEGLLLAIPYTSHGPLFVLPTKAAGTFTGEFISNSFCLHTEHQRLDELSLFVYFPLLLLFSFSGSGRLLNHMKKPFDVVIGLSMGFRIEAHHSAHLGLGRAGRVLGESSLILQLLFVFILLIFPV